MPPGSAVVWSLDPLMHGYGVVISKNSHGWLWVEFMDGHVDLYRPSTIVDPSDVSVDVDSFISSL